MFRAITNRYRYLTLVDKPITSLALTSIIELSAQTMQYCHTEFGMTPQLSVIIGAFGFRLGLQFLGLFFESMNLRRKDTLIHKWIEKIFLVDLQRDCTFYELSAQRYKAMAEYYKPQRLFASFMKNYTLLSFFRGCYYIAYDQSFQSFCMQTLSTHDPSFILPIPIILLNYLILTQSKHPFMIHMVRRQNRLLCLSIAFMGGLVFVALPTVFPLGYIGLALGHLTLKLTRHRLEAWKTYFRQKFNRKS